MLSRHVARFVAIAIGLAACMGAASAQVLSPAPYNYPPGGYRGVPLPGEDGVMTIDPADDERAATREPLSRPEMSRPDMYAPRADREDTMYPYDPRAERRMTPPEDIRASSPHGPAKTPYYGHFGDIPPLDAEAAARPGDAIGTESPRPPAAVGTSGAPGSIPANRPTSTASLPPEDQPEEGDPKELPPQFKRQIVDYITKEPAGTVVIDTSSTYLYLVLGNGKAMRYGIGVGREGFTWSGTERITRMAEWPDWHPPAEMIERQPYLPRFMAGGPGNPLGARALYLGKTIYRVHGTNQPSTIGKFVSSGCIRLVNEDVEDLFTRVKIGTRVVVLPGGAPKAASR